MTWTSCECGCGWEGEDEVTQFLIEEAAWLTVDVEDMNARREADAQELAEAEDEETFLRLQAKAQEALRKSRGAV